jgi:DNA-binding transcriptional MerR regulator
VGEIARRLGQPIHRIEYVIRSRNIKPESRAGSSRVFSEATVNRIASELHRIETDRGGGDVY